MENELSEKRIKLLSEDIIKKYLIIDWDTFTTNEILSIEFLKEFKDEIDWYAVSQYQKLDEDTIIEFQDKVIWILISRCQKLSENFIRRFHS